MCFKLRKNYFLSIFLSNNLSTPQGNCPTGPINITSFLFPKLKIDFKLRDWKANTASHHIKRRISEVPWTMENSLEYVQNAKEN